MCYVFYVGSNSCVYGEQCFVVSRLVVNYGSWLKFSLAVYL